MLQVIIKCPLCEGESDASLLREAREYTYKGKVLIAESLYYKCHTCGEEYTTTESDTITLDNIHKAYNDLSN